MDLQLANRLQRHRKAHGYSQEALAAALGISRQAVSKWECGEASPDTENLIRLAKLYHISLDELILSDEARSDALAPAERSETSPNVGTPSKTEDETFHGGEKNERAKAKRQTTGMTRKMRRRSSPNLSKNIAKTATKSRRGARKTPLPSTRPPPAFSGCGPASTPPSFSSVWLPFSCSAF